MQCPKVYRKKNPSEKWNILAYNQLRQRLITLDFILTCKFNMSYYRNIFIVKKNNTL